VRAVLSLMETAIILAGGDSKRIGYPKSLLRLDGKTILELLVDRLKENFRELLLVTDRPEFYRNLPVKITGDIYTNLGKSSLRGIHAGLYASTTDKNFVVACDMPFVQMELIKSMYNYLEGAEATVPRIGSYYQPLFAWYRRSCLGAVEKCLLAGNFKVTDFYSLVEVYYFTEEKIDRADPHRLSFFNVNTPEDFEYARNLMKKNENELKKQENDNYK